MESEVGKIQKALWDEGMLADGVHLQTSVDGIWDKQNILSEEDEALITWKGWEHGLNRDIYD